MAHSPRTLPAQGPSGLVPDDISKQIIEQLQEDGRRSYAAIGKAIGLSEAAVRQRVQRLQDSGVMQIVAVTDPLTLGFHRQAMVAIKTDGDLEKVADQLAEMDEIDYVVISMRLVRRAGRGRLRGRQPPAGDLEPGPRGPVRHQYRDLRLPKTP